MNRNKALLLVLLLAAFSLSSCSGPKTACTVNCGGGGTGNVSFTMVADTFPPHPSLLSFRVIITGITLTSSTGTKTTLTPPSTPIDLMRLQSDSAFLGTLSNVPTATGSSITVALAAQQITFLNDSGVALTSPSCPANTVCSFNPGTNGSPVITFSQVISSNTGFGIDFNLANAVTLAGTTLNVSFNNSANANVISAFSLPRQGSNLLSGQLDLLEDFTGVVSLSSNTVTITSPTRGALTATATSNTVFDSDPSNTLCPTGTSTLAACVSNNEVVSVDAVFKSDGTFSIQEIEPVLSSQQDIAEGIVTSINSTNLTQFGIIVTDKPSALVSNSLIGSLNVGDFLTVNIPSPKPFLVDTKGLAVNSVSPGSLNFFANQTNTAALHLGQTVAVHVTSFTAASGTTPASANADTVILRWSRLTAIPVTSSSTLLNVNGLPSYFNFASSSQFAVQLFPGTPGTKGVTNFDGIPDGSLIVSGKAVSVRALFLENPGSTASPAFFAAKVRQH